MHKVFRGISAILGILFIGLGTFFAIFSDDSLGGMIVNIFSSLIFGSCFLYYAYNGKNIFRDLFR